MCDSRSECECNYSDELHAGLGKEGKGGAGLFIPSLASNIVDEARPYSIQNYTLPRLAPRLVKEVGELDFIFFMAIIKKNMLIVQNIMAISLLSPD
jgi:hypothetical protein